MTPPTSPLAALRPLLAAALLLATPVAAFERTQLSVPVAGQTITVELYRPEGVTEAPAPLMVIAHGSPRRAEDRDGYGPATFARQAETFAGAGFVVAVPIRRGYGGSGPWREGYGTCGAPDYPAAAEATAADLIAAIRAVRRLPGVDGARLVLFGHSAGAWGALAAAASPEMPEGLRGVVAFAPGRGSRAPGEVCDADRLVEAVAAFGRSRVPQLWLYSRNDRFFGPDLARRLHAAFTQAGGRARLVQAPPSGEDGHLYVRDIPAWRPEVERFLREIGASPASTLPPDPGPAAAAGEGPAAAATSAAARWLGSSARGR